MAAYAYTVTSLMRRVAKLGDVTGFAVYAGTVDVTNYNSTTQPTITEIKDKFKDIIAVVFDVSDNGHIFEWDLANDTVIARYFDYDAVADGAAIEVATDVDAGAANFIAFGLV